jgi:hypothetical protein
MNNYLTFAVDFDGTLCKHEFPLIGEPNQPMIDFCIRMRNEGHKLILWTCRCGERLDEAVKWCSERGLFFHAVNTNLPEFIVDYGSDSRKVCADYYIDDKSLNILDCV